MKKSFLFIKLISVILAAACILPLASCKKDLFKDVESTEDDLRVVGTVGGYEVYYDELYYLIMTCKDIMKAKYGEGIWKDETTAAAYSDELRDMVMERITANYAVLTLCEEYGFEEPLKNKDVIDNVNEQINSILYSLAIQNGIEVTLDESLSGDLTYKYEKGGKAKALELFNEALKETYLTERVMRLTLATEASFSELTSIMTGEKNEIIYSDADIEAFMLSDEFICTKHVFIEGLSEESLSRAKAVLDELRLGTSIESLIGGKYNDDVTAPSEGYYFTRGEMESAYEEAAFSLKAGEISDIVKTDIGYFIIKRCEKSTNYMLSNIATFSQQIIYAKANAKVAERDARLSLELSAFGKTLEFYKIAVAEESKGAK